MSNTKVKSGGNSRPQNSRPKTPEELLKGVDPKVRDDARWILGFEKDQARGGLIGHYDLGARAQKIRDFVTEDGTDKYGKQVIQDLSSFLDHGISGLYEAMRFYKQYSREEVEKLGNSVMPNGKWFTWNHARSLLTVRDDHRRTTLQKRCLEKGWSSPQLSKEVFKALGGQDRELPSVKKPKDLDGVLRQVEGATGRWLNGNEHVWSTKEGSLVAFAENLPVKEITSDRVKQLRKVKEDFEVMVAEGKKRIKDAERALDVLEEHMKK